MAQAKSSESSSSQPRKRGRKLLWLGGVLIVLLVALVGAAPTLVSMGVGQTYIVDQISARIEGDVEIDRLSVGWFSGQTIEGLRLSHKGKELLRVDRVEAPDVSLLGLVRGDLDVGTLRVVHPRPDVHVAEDGTIDLLAALQSTAPPTAKPEPARWPKGLKARIEIINGIIKLSAVGSKPIEADDVNVNIDASDPANIAAKLGGVVKQGGHSGSVDIAATLRDLVDADGAIDHARATLGGKATAADVPMDPIDEVLAKLLPQRDTLRSVIGPKATGTLTFDGTMEDVSITFDIDSRSLKGTQVKARYVNGMLTIDDTTTLKLRVLPETWPTIAALAGLNPRDTTLREAFDVILTP